MAVNPDQLWSTLDKIEQKLLSVIDDFDIVSQAAITLGGNVAKVLPVQLNASTDAIMALVNGSGQNSIKNLKEYVDAIPLGDLRTKSALETYKSSATGNPTTMSQTPNAMPDTTPDMSAGPRSAIARESKEINLDDYKKKPLKEHKLNENNEFSFDAIVDETDIDNIGYDSSIPQADLDYMESDLATDYDMGYDMPEDDFSFDDWESERINDFRNNGLEDKNLEASYLDAYEFGDNFSEPY